MSQPIAERMASSMTSTLFRQVMGRWATGVSVITVRCGDEVRGITVNSFTSVSLDPPLVLICIDKRARSHQLLHESGYFCINVLDERQQSLSDRFAGRRSNEHGDFSDCSNATTSGGIPILDGCLAYLACRVVDTRVAGDHTIFVGQVEDACTNGDGNPLIFFAGQYTSIVNGRSL